MTETEAKASGLAGIARALAERHAQYDDCPGLSMDDAKAWLDCTLGLILPQYTGRCDHSESELEAQLEKVRDLTQRLLAAVIDDEKRARDVTGGFLAALPEVADEIRLDADALLAGDPATDSLSEVVITYPGCYAVATYRLANRFYREKVPLFPRLLSEYAHRITGIDINPGANIGKAFFVDHGTSVVVGETAVIGDNVKLYQGVTLGALKVDSEYRNQKRHPTIEDNVVIYANATILGGDTVIGHDSIIGGNVWLTHSVLPYSRVMYKSTNEAQSGLDWSI